MTNVFEVLGSALSFVGGVVLTWETLSVRQRIKEESGARRLLDVLAKVGASDALKDTKGTPLARERALQLWFAERSFRWGWVGFLLMTTGFLFETLARF